VSKMDGYCLAMLGKPLGEYVCSVTVHIGRLFLQNCLVGSTNVFFVIDHEYSQAMMRDKTDRHTMEMFSRRGRPPKARALSDAERAKRYRKKLARGGQVRVTVTIPADRRDDLMAFVATLRDDQ
jgi:hypothetical protein